MVKHLNIFQIIHIYYTTYICKKGYKKDSLNTFCRIGNIDNLWVENYCLSLKYGYEHIFQSLSRVIQLWFDQGRMLNKISNVKQFVNNNSNLRLSSS